MSEFNDTNDLYFRAKTRSIDEQLTFNHKVTEFFQFIRISAFGPLGPKDGIGSLGLNPPIYLKIKQIKRNPRTRIHTRIFDHWKIQPLKLTNFDIFKKSPHAYTYEDFCHWKIQSLKLTNFGVFKNSCTRTHIRIFDHWKIQTYEKQKF